MPSWSEIEAIEPAFADRVRRLFDAGRHKTIATLRRDGSPRISGIECDFRDGELRFSSMTGARKLADLRRNPLFALHSPTSSPEPGREGEWPGEAKVFGTALWQGSTSPDGEEFIGDIREAVITGLSGDATRLVIHSWTFDHGLRLIERD